MRRSWEDRLSRVSRSKNEGALMRNIVLILLVLLLVGAFPAWPHSMNWGYAPSGLVSILLIVLIVMAVSGRL